MTNDEIRRAARELSIIDSAHPEWEKIAGTPGFRRWLSRQPLDIRKLAGSERGDDACRLIDLYVNETK